jgi:hypothetical protein
LADRIHDVTRRLKECALKDKLRREIRAEERERESALRAAYERKAERKRRELERLKHYEEVASQLKRAMRLRVLAEGMEQCGRFDDAEGLTKVAWIRHAANWLDPLLDTSWPAVDDVRDSHY